MSDEIYGWTGKLIRINLTTGEKKVEDSLQYLDFVGGMGITNKVMFDEVPAGTQPFDEANKIVFAAGPLSGSGVPMSSRTTVSTLSTFTKDNLIIDGHFGGQFAAQLKFAGWDGIIIEGKASSPVFVSIINDSVQINDATQLWGLGTRATTEALCAALNPAVCVAAIGPAGENLLPMSCLINSVSHSAGGGTGAVCGSKNLKAIAVYGEGAVQVADPEQILELSHYMLSELIGANNNHVVPTTAQPWSKYTAKKSRWTAQEGLYWEAAEGGPVETGICEPGNVNKVALRTMKSTFDLGDAAAQYTVKMSGCHSCPIRCYSQLSIPEAANYDMPTTGGSTCSQPWRSGTLPMEADGVKCTAEQKPLFGLIGQNVTDDLGLWCNYSQLYRDFFNCYKNGTLKRVLPPEEWDMISWDKIEAKDPTFIKELYGAISSNAYEISYLGHGTLTWMERWGVDDSYLHEGKEMISPRGWPLHHANENCAQVGALTNVLFNRDPVCHTAVNFSDCGLPIEDLKYVAEQIFGDGSAIDAPKNYTPMNEYKAAFTKFSILRDTLHDNLTLCNWTWPMTVSPREDQHYMGDLDLEAKFYTAVTGIETTAADLDLAAERTFTLQRANTVRGMGTVDMRTEHDLLCDWVYDKDPDIEAFAPGTDKMEREDFQTALTMFYRAMRWDEKTGAPTRAGLEEIGLKSVADELDNLGLLPA